MSNSTATFNTPNEVVAFCNAESLDGTPLSNYLSDQLFVTKDNYCFVIEELVQVLIKQNRFFNPYTGVAFDKEDTQKLLQIPEIINQKNLRQLKQRHCASHISSATLKALMQLAEGILNVDESYAGKYTAIPVAQSAYEKFNIYYLTLSDEERAALNDFWIDEWRFFHYWGAIIFGMNSQTFSDLYTSMNSSCIHSVAGSIFKMIFQLNPNVEFDLHLHPNVIQQFVIYIKSTVHSDGLPLVSLDAPQNRAAEPLENDNSATSVEHFNTPQDGAIDQPQDSEKPAGHFSNLSSQLFTLLAWIAIGAVVSTILFFTNLITVPIVFAGIGALTTLGGYSLQTLITVLLNKDKDPSTEKENGIPEPENTIHQDILADNTINDANTLLPVEREKIPSEVTHDQDSPRFFPNKNTGLNDPSNIHTIIVNQRPTPN